MAPCLTENELDRLQHGELSAQDRARADAHLQECSACSTRLKRRASATPNGDQVQGSTILFEQRSIAALNAAPLAIEGYQVQSEIHRGGQGIVYKAFQQSTNRTVAIKVLPFEHSATQRQKHRFEREVTLASNLRHPNIVTVYDSGLVQGRYYFVMEYIHGRPLDEHLKHTTLSVQDRLRLFSTICTAVSAAHQQGVTHRDLKPRNILVDGRGEPHVVDFGLAKGAPGSFAGGLTGSGSTGALSVTSEFLGTLAYAAPEQTKGDPALVGARTDVYSLGVILFEMLTGAYPYPVSGDMARTFQAICEAAPRRPSELAPGLDKDIDTIVLRALAKEPDRRYQSVAELQRDAEHWLANEPIEARRDSLTYVMRSRGKAALRRHRWAANIAVTALVAALVWNYAALLFWHWSWPVHAWERWMMAAFSPGAASAGAIPAAFEDVRIIAIDDQTPELVEEMAQREGIDDVRAGEWQSVRRLHGRLMQRLAAAGVRAVVWDIKFMTPSPHNPEFIAGMEALKAANVTTVIPVNQWAMSERPDELLASDIRAAGAAWGGDSLAPSDRAAWRAVLVVGRGSVVEMIGLSAAGVAAFKHPGMDVLPQIDPGRENLRLLYVPRGTPTIQVGSSIKASDTIALTEIRSRVLLDDTDAMAGIRLGDVVGDLALTLPSDEILNASTISYQQAMAMSDEDRARQFGGKLVLIGDLRRNLPKPDWHPTPDGRMLSGPHGHAIAIDGLLRSAMSLRYPSQAGFAVLIVLASAVGVAATRGSWRGRTVKLAGGVVLFIAIGVAAFWSARLLIDPSSAILAMGLAFIVAMIVRRLQRPAKPALTASSFGGSSMYRAAAG